MTDAQFFLQLHPVVQVVMILGPCCVVGWFAYLMSKS